MKEVDLNSLHSNQRLLVQELKKREVAVWVLDKQFELLEAEYKGHHEFILDRFTSKIPHTLTLVSRDKYVAKYLLKRNGLQVPEGKLFDKDQIDEAIEYGQSLGKPLIIKPNWGSHGDHVYMNLDHEDLENAIHMLLKDAGSEMPFFVERQFEGREHRIFITQNGDFAVVHRDPAHVIGDGTSSIRELAEVESEKRMNPRTTCLCPIALDNIVDEHLKKEGKNLDFILEKGKKIYLRQTSNVAKGATCTDATDRVHPSIIEIAKKALKVFNGLPYAGIDLLTTDETKEQTPDSYRILEVNPNPGFSMHMKPGEGKVRNVASFVADIIFPETKSQ